MDTFTGKFVPFLTCLACRTRVAESTQKGKDIKLQNLPQDHSICNWCRSVLPNSMFGTRFYKGRGETVQLKSCTECSQKIRTSYSKRAPKQIEIQKRPEKRKIQQLSSKKDCRKERKKKSRKEWEVTEHGKQVLKNCWNNRRIKVMNNPGLRLQEALMASMRERLRGERHDEQSVKLSLYTDFKSIDDLVSHFKTKLKPGMTLDNYGEYWSIGHRIPQRYYDFNDPNEIKKCNSLRNLDCDYEINPNPLNEPTNKEKNDTIPDDVELNSIGVDLWPKLFDGCMNDQKRADLRMSRFFK